MGSRAVIGLKIYGEPLLLKKAAVEHMSWSARITDLFHMIQLSISYIPLGLLHVPLTKTH